MQAGGVTTTDTYNVSGRVLIDGRDIGADVQSVSLGRDIPSGLPGGSGFTSASGRVTATWGDAVSGRVDHPWSADPSWPPRPNAQVEVLLSDGSGEWSIFKGVIVDPSGSLNSRTISFGVRDNYRSLDTLVTIPALSNSMPALVDANVHRYIGMYSCFLTDMLLRAGGRYCTPSRQPGDVVGATLMGSMWPERGTITESHKDVPDGGTISFPNWEVNEYGVNVQNVSALYEPNIWSGTPGGGRLTHHPFELTQEVMPVSSGASYLRARFAANGGRVALVHSNTAVQVRYYPPEGGSRTLIEASKSHLRRATARFSLSGSTLTAELRTLSNAGQVVSHGVVTHNVGSGLNGVLQDVWANGEGSQGAFQAAFAITAFSALNYEPNAVLHVARAGQNSLIGVPSQLDANVLDLLNDQADAEFAQWWIDEHDVLQWWDRGLLAQRPIVGTLTGTDHVRELSWSHDHDSARHRVHVKYQEPEVTQRWRTNLTLWEGRGETLEEGDTSEIFVNVPNDEIWLGVDTENPTRYQRTTQNWWVINRGIRTVMGGIAIDNDGNERTTNSIIPSVRKVTDETYVFEHDITALGSSEQAVFEFPSERDADPALWARWRGKGLPILRGKKRILFQEAVSTSDVTGDSSSPDYTHDHGWWIQEIGYAGRTADYAAASLTQPRPRVDGLDIMPVLALQVGDRVRIRMPDVAELDITGVVTSNNIDADLAAGTIQQSINVMPTNVSGMGRRWQDFGDVHGDTSWQAWAGTRSGDTWSDFGSNPLK